MLFGSTASADHVRVSWSKVAAPIDVVFSAAEVVQASFDFTGFGSGKAPVTSVRGRFRQCRRQRRGAQRFGYGVVE